MDISIRAHVLNNLDDSSYDDVRSMIEESIREGEEITLPGLGVLFEVLWNSVDENTRSQMVNNITQAVSKKGQ